MSSMDSVTSTSSRIRQFGLYRTIDARTDNFLRSSRRRQIRIGCMCSAISTAITVTVVVSVILVYQYNIISESKINKKITIQTKWLEMQKKNFSRDIDLKFDKKINIDSATLKLLPILFRALNKNTYLDNIIEEYSTAKPPYKGKKEPEIYFERNIFSDAKNWFKVPLLKRNVLDYKTLPLVYSKRTFPYSHHLSSIRKKFTEGRLLNYFDRIVNNEKASKFRFCSSSNSDFGYTENSIEISKEFTTRNKTKSIILNKVSHLKSKKRISESLRLNKVETTYKPIYKNQAKTEKLDCKCSTTTEFIKKLIPSIYKLTPARIYTQKKPKFKFAESTTHFLRARVTTQRVSAASTPTIKITTTLLPQNTLTERIKTQLEVNQPNQQTATRATFTKKLKTLKKTNYTTKRDRNKDLLSFLTQNTITTPKVGTKTDKIKILPKASLTDSGSKKNTTGVTTYFSYFPSRYNTTIIITKLMSLLPSRKNTISKITNNVIPIPTTIITTDKDFTHLISNITDIPTTKLKEEDYVTDINLAEVQNTTVNNETENVQSKSIIPLHIVTSENKKETTESTRLSSSSDKHFTTTEIAKWQTSSADYNEKTLPIYSYDTEYEKYFHTTPKANNDFDNLDVHSFELLKVRNMISSVANRLRYDKIKNIMNKVQLDTTSSNDCTVEKIDTSKDEDLKRTSDLFYFSDLPSDYDTFGTPQYDDKSTIAIDFNITNSKTLGSLIQDNKQKLIKLEHTERDSFKKIPVLYENSEEQDFLEDWIQNTQKLDDTTATYEKHTHYSSTKKCNKSLHNVVSSTTVKNDWIMKDYEQKFSESFMIPLMRPPYLDIRRSTDLKSRETTDYDINLTNNIFDLPN